MMKIVRRKFPKELNNGLPEDINTCIINYFTTSVCNSQNFRALSLGIIAHARRERNFHAHEFSYIALKNCDRWPTKCELVNSKNIFMLAIFAIKVDARNSFNLTVYSLSRFHLCRKTDEKRHKTVKK